MNTQAPLKTEKQGHAPSPWTIDDGEIRETLHPFRTICDFDNSEFLITECELHQKLIVCAPELLEALQSLCENRNPMYMKSEDFFSRIDKGLAVIAKATA